METLRREEPAALRLPPDAPRRVVIEAVSPVVDDGRFAVKRIDGDVLVVRADVFCEGHDLVAARVVHTGPGGAVTVADMTPLGNDRFEARVHLQGLGQHAFRIEAWIDRFATWRDATLRKRAAGRDIAVDLLAGAAIVDDAGARLGDGDGQRRMLARLATALRDGEAAVLDDTELVRSMQGLAGAARCATRDLPVTVDRERARFSAWYELFPRSTSRDPGRPGTLRDTTARLAEIADMGFDVVYLPPIHPIGVTHRKGKDNALVAEPDDVGSPWAIGNDRGGHFAIAPELGTFDDFRALVAEARRLGMEVALDLAFQCSPDHPWVHDHPEWFHHRPDGSIQPAENPPKRYDDIFPLDFESTHWHDLWHTLRQVVRFWIDHGVRIFRVDNPHTKPFAFWEWLIGRIRQEHPDVLFLSEAFTRPAIMNRLAKLGFTQSYTYFAWRRDAWELREYFTELTAPPVSDFFRPNAWPNTPDILTEQLQHGSRSVFLARLVLAATLSASYGVYGPPFELCVTEARDGVEEYAHNEKYEVRWWDTGAPWSLRDAMTVLNRARRCFRALQTNETLRFHPCDDDRLLCFSKTSPCPPSPDAADAGTPGHEHLPIVVVVNAEADRRRSGFVTLDLDALGLDRSGISPDEPFVVHDLLGGGNYRWQGPRNYVDLDPNASVAHVFAITPGVRREQSFPTFL